MSDENTQAPPEETPNTPVENNGAPVSEAPEAPAAE